MRKEYEEKNRCFIHLKISSFTSFKVQKHKKIGKKDPFSPLFLFQVDQLWVLAQVLVSLLYLFHKKHLIVFDVLIRVLVPK